MKGSQNKYDDEFIEFYEEVLDTITFLWDSEDVNFTILDLVCLGRYPFRDRWSLPDALREYRKETNDLKKERKRNKN